MKSPLLLVVVASALAIICTNEMSGKTIRAKPSEPVTPLAAQLKAGDTLILSPGIYREQITLSGLHGMHDRPIRIVGEAGAIIEPRGRDGILFFGDTASAYVIVEGLTIRKAKRAGIIVNGSHNITIRNCNIGNNGQWGVQTIMSIAVTVEDCTLFGSEKEHGVYFSTTDRPVVRRCRIYDNAACGVHFNGDKSEGGDGLISEGVVQQNVIYNNGRIGGAGINMDSAEKMLVTDNVLYGNLSGGITAFTQDGLKSGDGNRIINNVVYFAPGKGRFGVQVIGSVKRATVIKNVLVCGKGPALHVDGDTMAGLTADRNLYYVHGKDKPIMVDEGRVTLPAWQRRSGVDTASLSADPLFVDPDNNDLELREDSPVRVLRGDP